MLFYKEYSTGKVLQVIKVISEVSTALSVAHLLTEVSLLFDVMHKTLIKGIAIPLQAWTSH
jgi:hypothetical protein